MRCHAVLGTGAGACLHAGRLAAAGHPVRSLVRGDVAALRAGGLTVTSIDGDVRLPPVQVVERPEDLGRPVPPDVVLVELEVGDRDPAGRWLRAAT